MDINNARKENLLFLQQKIGYTFTDIDILNNALTHSSYVSGKNAGSEYNERLEFIGDSVLNMIVSLFLYSNCKKSKEGQLTRLRANIVCEQSLYMASSKLELGKYILMSKGEENTGGRERTSILADAFEALIAAIYLDGGMKHVQSFILDNLKDTIASAMNNKIMNDYKSFLQEYIQKDNLGVISYVTNKEDGPDHNKLFEVSAYLNDRKIGTASGKSKKEAQQAAAKEAIQLLEAENEK